MNDGKRLALPVAAALLAALAALAVLAVGMGAYPLEPAQVLQVLAREIGLPGGAVDPMARSVVMSVRLPRVLLAVVAGAGLASA
ncbi:MAG: iron chelate uptake ABC transporter family permease subunit, partial [Duodenibacillus sp.]|nr:iron chelate uptake ABC transporter family permease subunit [Duodenibacillus sp.]